MRKRGKLLAVLLAMILVGLVWLVLSSAPREPVYQGKPLHYWLAGYDAGNYNAAHPKGPSAPTEQQANQAIKAIGTNAIPSLIRMLKERDSSIKSVLNSLATKQHAIPVEFWSPINQTVKAMNAFEALGPQPVDVAPELAEIYESEPCAYSRQAVPAILSYAAPTAPETVPLLLRALAETNDALVRGNAAYAIGQVHPRADLVVPGLAKALNDPDPWVQKQAAESLAVFGAEARSAVPTLVRIIPETWTNTAPASPAGAATAASLVPLGSGLTISVGPGFAFAPGRPKRLSTVIGYGPSPADAGAAMVHSLRIIDPEAAAKAGL